MAAYYNEIDPYAAQWLRNLIAASHIAPGDVDERSIVDVQASDLTGYTQCHFFAGIGGWSYALRLAGWDDSRPVWTGSCPCQPFSVAGKGGAQKDERHLWPAWFRLIATVRPSAVFGEQVAGAIAHGWLDDAFDDLEREGYETGAAVLPACSAGAPHKRDRLWFVADPAGRREQPSSAQFNERGFQEEILRKGGDSHDWNVEPAVGRVANGIPARTHKLRAYGNAIVPQVAAEFIKAYRGCLA